MELLEVTVCSPSVIMAISPLLSEPRSRLLTEELWELAEMDMLGTDWELSMLFTVPVRSRYCSASCRGGIIVKSYIFPTVLEHITLSSSLTASLVRAIRSMMTVSGRSRHRKRCCGRGGGKEGGGKEGGE
ncbi:hypothetical protein EYF80_043889 [Liparis tanakae]|uniref:Uncharacterized protein n=1 Tax=Liparis tanakae TaxID=230148 RepID=A0A4Z2FYG5_9TELE|nr:hypothetical protein EYF80_043889 [Liparis tanakae]